MDLSTMIARRFQSDFNPGDWRCDLRPSSSPKCAGTMCVRTFKPSVWPKVLRIQLKRFKQEGRFIRKDIRKVPFDFDLLLPFDSAPRYQLKGIIVHLGESDHGHYIAYVLMSDAEWYLCDDPRPPKLVRAADVLHANPYILVFETN